MKCLFKIVVMPFIFLLTLSAHAIGSLDVDYNFIDTAFEGIKPVTNKQFDDTINRLTPQPVPDTFGGRLKAFLFGRKMGVESQPKIQDAKIDTGGEKKAIEDMKNGTYYIKLVVSVLAQDGSIIPLGNYKIQERNDENINYLVFYQGAKEYGKLRLQRYDDTKKGENDITYSRVDIVDDNYVRIVYSTLKDTKCAMARIYGGVQ